MPHFITRSSDISQAKEQDSEFDAAQLTEPGFLPDFCRGEMVINVVVLAECLAIVATIIIPPLTASVFQDLFYISLFLQWIALTSIGVLCAARPYLNRLGERRAVLMAYLLLLCVTWVVSEFALWLMAGVDIIESPRPPWYAYFHGQNLTVSAIINALALRYFVARHQLRQKTLAVERARATILKYRIRPHFLFNSMNIVASLTRRAPVRAETAIEDIADLFRLMLDDSKDLMPIQNEIKIARKYLKLEKLRLEDRLNANWHTESLSRTTKTPALMLQLLLENAIHHGIEPLPKGGNIDIRLWLDDGRLHISIISPYAELSEVARRDGDTALNNIRLRLHDLYGENADLKIERDDRSMAVHISHPAFGESSNEDLSSR
jgi:two-component system sensor histidine kinase AlgZ